MTASDPLQASPAPEQPQGNASTPPESGAFPALSEEKRRELWLYVAVSVATVEMLLAVGGLCYGFIAGSASGTGGLVFPWVVWGVLAVIVPALLLLMVHLADVGLFRTPRGGDTDSEWQEHLPERVRRLYRIIKGAPAVVVLLGIVGLGAALLTIEGALSALGRFAGAFEPYIAHIVGGTAAVIIAGIGAAIRLNYRTRRLYEEYEFRREVLEKTGVIIVDKGSMALPPGGTGPMPYALASADSLRPGGAGRALPPGESADVLEVTPEPASGVTSGNDSGNASHTALGKRGAGPDQR